MPKDERFESRLSAEGRAALETIAAHYGVSRAAVIEMTLREAARRLPRSDVFGLMRNVGEALTSHVGPHCEPDSDPSSQDARPAVLSDDDPRNKRAQANSRFQSFPKPTRGGK